MYKENILNNITQNIQVNDSIENEISSQLSNVDKLFSIIVYSKECNGKLSGWLVQYNFSQTSSYNTLDAKDVKEFLVKELNKKEYNPTSSVYCHKQPSLNLIIKLYEPLIRKLAKEQRQRWQFLEYEDLCQMCSLVISDLYYKKYYIHKRLIARAFNNYVLMHIRKDKCKPEMVSLEQEYNKSDDDSSVTIADMIPDVDEIYRRQDKDKAIADELVLGEMKSIVIDFIGPRQYDQLLREYGGKSTTAWSRKLMTTIKAHLFDMGITNKSFSKYYN